MKGQQQKEFAVSFFAWTPILQGHQKRWASFQKALHERERNFESDRVLKSI
jgi:hypothetical protein